MGKNIQDLSLHRLLKESELKAFFFGGLFHGFFAKMIRLDFARK